MIDRINILILQGNSINKACKIVANELGIPHQTVRTRYKRHVGSNRKVNQVEPSKVNQVNQVNQLVEPSTFLNKNVYLTQVNQLVEPSKVNQVEPTICKSEPSEPSKVNQVEPSDEFLNKNVFLRQVEPSEPSIKVGSKLVQMEDLLLIQEEPEVWAHIYDVILYPPESKTALDYDVVASSNRIP